MIGLPAIFAHGLMPIQGENSLISIPAIIERAAALVRQRDASPELKTTGLRAVTDEVGHDLPSAATQGHPHPALVGFLEHERPQLIQFQHIIRLGRGQLRFQGRQLGCPPFNPTGYRPSRNAKEPFNATQADPLQNSALDLLAYGCIVAPLGAQCAITRTGIAVIFLAAFVISSIFHQIRAALFWTAVRYNRLDHEKVLLVSSAVCLECFFIPHQSILRHYL